MKAKSALCIFMVCILSWTLASCKSTVPTLESQSFEIQASSLISSSKNSKISGGSDSSKNTSSESFSVPIIKSIDLLNDKGNTLDQAGGWIKLSSQSKIRVRFEGKATKVDFYTIPTGTNTYLLQQCIGTVDLTGKDSSAELNWNVPDSFMGYIFVLVYNGDVARSSDQFFIKAINEK